MTVTRICKFGWRWRTSSPHSSNAAKGKVMLEQIINSLSFNLPAGEEASMRGQSQSSASAKNRHHHTHTTIEPSETPQEPEMDPPLGDVPTYFEDSTSETGDVSTLGDTLTQIEDAILFGTEPRRCVNRSFDTLETTDNSQSSGEGGNKPAKNKDKTVKKGTQKGKGAAMALMERTHLSSTTFYLIVASLVLFIIAVIIGVAGFAIRSKNQNSGNGNSNAYQEQNVAAAWSSDMFTTTTTSGDGGGGSRRRLRNLVPVTPASQQTGLFQGIFERRYKSANKW